MKAVPRKISANDYNKFRWNILPNYDDYPIVEENDNTESEWARPSAQNRIALEKAS